MDRALGFLVVALYNLALLGGASYLYYYKDGSGWLFVLAILFAANWKEDKEKKDGS